MATDLNAGAGRVDEQDLKAAEQAAEIYGKLTKELSRVIIGQDEVLKQVLIALFAQGHCLLEGVPGLAKTLMISSISEMLSLDFSRIQFTPDLMPSDIVGTEILEEEEGTGRRRMKFVKGPIFGNIILGDEINRTPPKTQAALLQAMQEFQVTIAGQTFDLTRPFLVLGTQNPIEQEGTYPLPEAQLDRFMFNVRVDYPTLSEEEQILAVTSTGEEPETRKVLSAKSIVYLQKQINQIEAGPLTINYAARLVRATRPDDESAPEFVRELIDWGAGPRAGQFLLAGGKAMAAMAGRPSVSMKDIRDVAIPVLRHRISTNFQAQAEGMSTDDVVNRLIAEVPEPTVSKYD